MDQPISSNTINQRRRIQTVVVVGVLATLCAAAWGVNRSVRPSLDMADIVVSTVRLGNIANTINASGVVIPVHEELVTSPIQTRVARVHAKLGQSVKAGELLLELDNQAPRLAADSLKEQLAQQENRILGMTLDMEQKRKQLVSNIELLELDLQSARVKWERYQTLRKSGAVSGEDMLTAELNVKRREIELRQQRELIDDNRRATSSSVEGARLQKSILIKQIAQQQALLDQTQVRAPFAGMLSSLMAEEGASVAMGQLVARVSELSNYRVEASVSDFHANLINPGQRVRVEQAGSILPGKVHTVLPEIQNGTIKLLVHLDQPSHPMLRNKMRVDVNIVTEEKSGTLVSDSGPAFNGKGRQPVFVLRDGVARKTVLDLGAGDGRQIEIVAGAKAGDRLIISTVGRHKDQDNIRISD